MFDGGSGEKIARYYGATAVRTLCYGVKKQFVDRYVTKDFCLLYSFYTTKVPPEADVWGDFFRLIFRDALSNIPE